VVGVGGAVTATVLACRSTMKLERSLDRTQSELNALELRRSRGTVSPDDYKKINRRIVLEGAWDITKLYTPSVVVGALSIACLTKSHQILTERNAQLTAAYVGLQKFLEGYRGRVREKIGEEEERNVYYASTPVELVEDTPNGPKKIFGTAPGMKSPYAALFTQDNTNWQENGSFNKAFLRIQEDLLTNKLRSQGSLMLNEVYDRLDLPRTSTGAVVGWMIGHPDSDDFVEISIDPVHDYHGTLMLDFNVAGVVYQMLNGRASGRKSR
jgi:hypothetical protein